jgi:putative sterol carrier protein
MTYHEQFETLKKRLLNIDETKFTKSFATQVNMTDEDCSGSFYISNMDGSYAVEPYDYKDRTSMITASSKAISDILTGKVDPVKAFLSGDVAIEGDLEDLKMLSSAVVKPARRTRGSAVGEKSEAGRKTAGRRRGADS